MLDCDDDASHLTVGFGILLCIGCDTGGTEFTDGEKTFGFLGNKLGLYLFSLYMLSVLNVSDFKVKVSSFSVEFPELIAGASSESLFALPDNNSSSSSFEISMTSPSCLKGTARGSSGLDVRAFKFPKPPPGF